MNKSFFPKSDSLLLIWALNYKQKIVDNALSLGMSPDDVTEEVAICDNIIGAVNLVNAHKKLLKGSIDARDKILDNDCVILRNNIARHKTAKLYTETIGQELGIIGSANDFDPASYKPEFFAELFGGNIRIKFKKKGVDGINIYKRQKGNKSWALLSRATKSPFDFHTVLAVENQPEHWEFRVFGVIKDAEIGLASDIVELVYGE